MIDESILNHSYRYALALCHDENMAYDLVHDAVLKMRGRIVFNKEAYLKKVIRHVFYDSFKSGQPALEYDESEVFSFEDMAIARNEVALYLERLDPSDRELLYFICVEELTYKEASKAIGVPIGTIMSRLHRCREKLREIRESHG